MGYLNNQVVTVDAILTKKGRETLDKNDGLIVSWLGKDIDALFKNRSTIYRKVNINQAYDYCDKPKGA